MTLDTSEILTLCVFIFLSFFIITIIVGLSRFFFFFFLMIVNTEVFKQRLGLLNCVCVEDVTLWADVLSKGLLCFFSHDVLLDSSCSCSCLFPVSAVIVVLQRLCVCLQ